MKQIFLVRHAKSDWNNSEIKDIERPLNDRGYSNANQMSKAFKYMPDLIISSPAIRAISTALIFARNINYDSNKIQIKKELYESSVKDYLSVIHQLNDQYDTIMLFAHNPTISNVAETLVKALPMEMPTCAIAGISFDCSKWLEVKNNQGNLFLFDYQKK